MTDAIPLNEVLISDTGTYAEIEQFYAAQMQLLDDERTAEWAGTFTEEGTFALGDRVVRGAADIARVAGEASAGFAAAGITRRHCVNNLAIAASAGRPGTPSMLRARCYVSVLESSSGGEVTLSRSTVCDDELVRVEGRWRVRDRRISRDGIDP